MEITLSFIKPVLLSCNWNAPFFTKSVVCIPKWKSYILECSLNFFIADIHLLIWFKKGWTNFVFILTFILLYSPFNFSLRQFMHCSLHWITVGNIEKGRIRLLDIFFSHSIYYSAKTVDWRGACMEYKLSILCLLSVNDTVYKKNNIN